MSPLIDLNASESATTRPWHLLSQETALNELGTTATGPNSAEASQRMERYGPNRLPEVQSRSPLMRVVAHFHNLLIQVLPVWAGRGACAMNQCRVAVMAL
ncbi:MAG: cation-transporting P-type ATPase [Sedimenticolaceae bacterium]